MNFTKEDLGGKNPQFYSKRNCLWCNKEFVYRIKLDAKFCCASCSSLHAARNTDAFEKTKATKLKKYGSATYTNIEKMKQTCLDKYGVDNASKSKEVIDKIKQVNLAKYGVECSFQAKEVKDKIKETLIERYGVDHPTKSQEIRDKVKATCMERYGVSNVSQTNAVREFISDNKLSAGYDVIMNEILSSVNCVPLFNKSAYIGRIPKIKYKFKCNTCGTEFESDISYMRLPRCQTCFPYSISKAQQEIITYIKSLNVNNKLTIKTNVRDILPSGKEIDIFIPELLLGIEYDSFYYHGENYATKGEKYHLNKTEEAESIGIHLIHVFEDEWHNKKQIVLNKIKNLVCVSESKEFARKTTIRKIDYLDFKNFIDDIHIQGAIPASIYYGAYNKNNELIGVASFSKPRVALGSANDASDSTMELVRYATKLPVIGLCSKFIANLKKENFGLKTVISYADRRYTNIKKNLYIANGFTLDSISSPNYWYFLNGICAKHHRYGFRKSELHKKLDIFDPNLSEWENMKNNDYDRIWDCGNLKFVYHFDK